MLTSEHGLLGLGGMDLRRGGQNGCLNPRAGEAFGEVKGPMRNSPLRCQFLCVRGKAAGQAHHLDPVDSSQGIEMLSGNRTFAGNTDLHKRKARPRRA